MSDHTDDIEWQADEYLCVKGERESAWQAGYHETQDDRKIELKDMTVSHLENTIRYFSDHDTTPLEKELNSRKCQS